MELNQVSLNRRWPEWIWATVYFQSRSQSQGIRQNSLCDALVMSFKTQNNTLRTCIHSFIQRMQVGKRVDRSGSLACFLSWLFTSVLAFCVSSIFVVSSLQEYQILSHRWCSIKAVQIKAIVLSPNWDKKPGLHLLPLHCIYCTKRSLPRTKIPVYKSILADQRHKRLTNTKHSKKTVLLPWVINIIHMRKIKSRKKAHNSSYIQLHTNCT